MTLEEKIRERQKTEIFGEEAPETLYLKLLEKIRTYHPSNDLSLVEKAFVLADEAHKGVKRKSGEPYIIHPLHVAIILSELQLDKESIAAALMHDVIEDTDYTYEDIKNLFTVEIADLVNGVTKLAELKKNVNAEEFQGENLRKMFLAMAKDIRVILIKLADRLHNMRTLEHMRPDKQQKISRETMDIYSPLANRLGISKVKVELDDIALSYLEPQIYQELRKNIEEDRPEREAFVQEIISEIKEQIIEDTGIDPLVYGRVKHMFSIYKKMKNQNKTLDQIYDIFAIRIVVDNVKECYSALGIAHKMFKPVPGRFKDYIAMPKPNGYKSLHTTLISENGRMFEVQIRTHEMHKIAEYGIAAHWKYKEGKAGENIGQAEVDKMAWLREILELQKNNESNAEFVSEVKSELNLFSDTVFCFTPRGQVITLPAGSTPIDFAYRIHSAVGNRMVGATINGKMQPITYEIQNGDRVDIQTSMNSTGPSLDWLKHCKSPQARTKIRQWFKNHNRAENIEQGRLLFEKYCKSKNLVLTEVCTPEAKEAVLRKYGFADWDSILAAIGHGGLKEGQVVNKMREMYIPRKPELTDEEVLEKMKQDADKNSRLKMNRMNQMRAGDFIIKSYLGGGSGGGGMVCMCAQCCGPLPGDEIVGYVTRNRGIKVHRTDCPNFLAFSEAEKARTIEVEWAPETMKGKTDKRDGYTVGLTLYAYDKPGILASVSQTLAENNYNIEELHSNKSQNRGIATIILRITVESVEALEYIKKKLSQIDHVFEVKRN